MGLLLNADTAMGVCDLHRHPRDQLFKRDFSMFTIFSPIRSGAAFSMIVLCASMASAEKPVIALGEDIVWRTIGTSGTQPAVLSGEPAQDGSYAMMVKVPDGSVWQPGPQASEWRHITVISGTLVWTIGNSFQEGSMTALSPGSFWTVPNNADQRGWASNGDVLAVVTAVGPRSATSVGDD